MAATCWARGPAALTRVPQEMVSPVARRAETTRPSVTSSAVTALSIYSTPLARAARRKPFISPMESNQPSSREPQEPPPRSSTLSQGTFLQRTRLEEDGVSAKTALQVDAFARGLHALG